MYLIRTGHEDVLALGQRARLGYCLNLHASETLADVHSAIERYVLRVRDRVFARRTSDSVRGKPSFGVGMYLGASVARQLASDAGALADLAALLRDENIDPFTFNAFPYEGFQRDGLKERVYLPTWQELERLVYTLDVANVAAALRTELGGAPERSHVSISTHPGGYGPPNGNRGELREYAEQMGRAVGRLAELEEETGYRTVLSLEAEPDASARNGRALDEFLTFARLVGVRVIQEEFGRPRDEAAAILQRHLGTCLDCCHSAVEFEEPREAIELATHDGPLGKLQFSSALRLARPGERAAAVDALLSLDEPRFLHQVTATRGRDGAREFLHVPDLGALATECDDERSRWRDADEWRCHFHVPVDLEEVAGLGTTRDHADAILATALEHAGGWGAPELHVEIETYTWSVMPEVAADARDDDAVVEGLVREYEHVLGVCAESGWRPLVMG